MKFILNIVLILCILSNNILETNTIVVAENGLCFKACCKIDLENNTTDSNKCCNSLVCKCCFLMVSFHAVLDNYKTEKTIPPFIEKNKIFSKYDKYSFNFTANVFHPPKFV